MVAGAEKSTVITLQVDPSPQYKKDFTLWQGKFNATIIGFRGFVSLEFLGPVNNNSPWKIVQRFSDLGSAENWLNSSIRRELIQELKIIAQDSALDEQADEESSFHNGVTEMFMANVTAENENAFKSWSARMHQTEANFPGFRGVYVQSPPEGHSGNWITLLQFDSIVNLDRWLASPERLELLKESEGFISTLQANRFISPFSGWFSSIAKEGVVPAAWKQTMLVLLGLFPIVMLEQKFLSPYLTDLSFSLAMFLANTLSVLLVAYVATPIFMYIFKWWLMPSGYYIKQKNALGAFLVVVLYALSIALFILGAA